MTDKSKIELIEKAAFSGADELLAAYNQAQKLIYANGFNSIQHMIETYDAAIESLIILRQRSVDEKINLNNKLEQLNNELIDTKDHLKTLGDDYSSVAHDRDAFKNELITANKFIVSQHERLSVAEPLARQLLWIAFSCYDRIYPKKPQEYAIECAMESGINNIDEANAWISGDKK